MLSLLKRQSGFSLVELAIAMALGTVSLAALMSLAGGHARHTATTLYHQRLLEDLKATATLISGELMRAGHDASAAQNLLSRTPSTFANSLALSAFRDETPNSCILFAYDRNRDGRLNTEPPHENFGFRLRDKAIEVRQRGASCQAQGWQDVTDTGVINIVDLRFALNIYGGHLSSVTLSIEAAAAQQPSITAKINRVISLP